IDPPQALTDHALVFDTYNDHRMAMSMSLIGLRRPNVAIANPACVAKTYPTYWKDLARVDEAALERRYFVDWSVDRSGQLPDAPGHSDGGAGDGVSFGGRPWGRAPDLGPNAQTDPWRAGWVAAHARVDRCAVVG